MRRPLVDTLPYNNPVIQSHPSKSDHLFYGRDWVRRGSETPYSTPLHQFVDRWVRAHDATWEWLFAEAGLANAVGTKIRHGSMPRPGTLRKLSSVMRVPARRLYQLAGYFDENELEPEQIDIADPELGRFFRQYQWDEFTEDEKELIRMGIRMALQARKAREQEPEDELGTEQE